MHNGVPLKPFSFEYMFHPPNFPGFPPIRNAMRKDGEKSQSALEVSGSLWVALWAKRVSHTVWGEKCQQEEKGGHCRKNLIEQCRRCSVQKGIMMGFSELSLLLKEPLYNSVLPQIVHYYLCFIQQQRPSYAKNRRRGGKKKACPERAAGN